MAGEKEETANSSLNFGSASPIRWAGIPYREENNTKHFNNRGTRYLDRVPVGWESHTIEKHRIFLEFQIIMWRHHTRKIGKFGCEN